MTWILYIHILKPSKYESTDPGGPAFLACSQRYQTTYWVALHLHLWNGISSLLMNQITLIPFRFNDLKTSFKYLSINLKALPKYLKENLATGYELIVKCLENLVNWLKPNMCLNSSFFNFKVNRFMQNNDDAAQIPQHLTTVNVKYLGSKMSSKREVS